jgi:hypothetical protein
MTPSRRQRAANSIRWPIPPWGEPPAPPEDGFRPFSYHRVMARQLCDLIAGTVSNACASAHGDGP